jgi:hypothetical protein
MAAVALNQTLIFRLRPNLLLSYDHNLHPTEL